MSLFNNITQDFYNTIHNYGTNPIILVILILIIIIYYIIFAFLGNNNNSYNSYNSSSGGFIFFEAILWGLLILLVLINAMAYFFNVNIISEFKQIFYEKPEIQIESSLINKDISSASYDTKEVYHVPGNRFTYHDAKAICKAFDGELATYEQLLKEQKNGASWCSFGWTNDQLGLYPTSQSDFNRLKKIKGHEYDCGIPGINGGYVSNPHIKLGSNCYGYKPKITDLESSLLENNELYPKTEKEKLFQKRVEYWRNRIGNIIISPFNSDNWFKIPST